MAGRFTQQIRPMERRRSSHHGTLEQASDSKGCFRLLGRLELPLFAKGFPEGALPEADSKGEIKIADKSVTDLHTALACQRCLAVHLFSFRPTHRLGPSHLFLVCPDRSFHIG